MKLLVLLATSWALVVAAGWTVVTRYEVTPTESGVVPETWPSSAVAGAPTDRPVLLVFIHPHCPCTRATVSELDLLATRVHASFDLRAVFVQPPGTSPEWVETGTWRAAGRIPGLSRLVDEDGRLARSFGASVSGETLLYGTDGTLLFAGGITASRGHAGLSLGRQALEAWGRDETPGTRSTLVFGCPLLEERTRPVDHECRITEADHAG